MAKVPYTEEQAQSLVKNGHLTHDTFQRIKSAGGFMQGLDEGGEVQAEPAPLQVEPVTVDQEAPAAAPMAPLQVEPVAAQSPPVPIDPTLDRQIASTLAAPQTPEAGHVSPREIVGGGPKQQTGAMPIPGQDYLNQIDQGMKDTREGIQKGAKAQASSAQEGANLMSGIAGEMRRQAAQDHIEEWKRQEAAQEGMDKLTQMSTELQSAKIDPNHYWADKSTGQKITAALSIALGGIGGGLTGHGGNAALDIINKAIDRDIDAQKANLDNRRGALSVQSSLYGMSQKNFADSAQARLAARSLGLQAAEMQLKAIAAKSQDPIIQANAQKTLGELQVQQAQARQQLAFQGYQMRAVSQAMGSGAGQINSEALPKEYRERYVDGMGFAKDPEVRRKVEDFKASDDAFQKDLKGLKNFTLDHRGTTMDRQTVNKGKALAAALQNSYRKAESMGVYKESEAKFMENLIGDDPTTWFTYAPQLDALGESAKNARDGFYKAHISNYQPVREGAPVARR